MNESQVVQALAALAHPLRLQVFRALVVVGPAGLTPGAIVAGVGVPATTLSFHLKELTSAGLVTQERNGRNLVYRASFDQMNGVLGYLTENCCQGARCAQGPELEPESAPCAC
jgi:DNA-binding transcriptional ArsR family regulator